MVQGVRRTHTGFISAQALKCRQSYWKLVIQAFVKVIKDPVFGKSLFVSTTDFENFPYFCFTLNC